MENINCACGKQIVWYFNGKPTVIVCEKCEKTFYWTAKKCDICGGKLTYFTKK